MPGQFNSAYSAVANAQGVARVDIQPPRMHVWTVSQVTVEMDSAPIGSACFLRMNGSLITPLVSTGDVAAGEPYLQLLATDTLSVEWRSVTPGSVGQVFVFYTEGR
ncbi:hypothetical protein E1265_21375 [Streptomyces sp. 8K308]|uniref:hypothetical protein n=1 Tax=Streptomyces sp. 8K308 TaxID=2530388 RepID=UPI001048276B|nr:hypothetical protein [Streptomyces sp. 8K308]TDC20624.1 hypothetical protein E1265_21375 [Streptomyces sp. 8K308]